MGRQYQVVDMFGLQWFQKVAEDRQRWRKIVVNFGGGAPKSLVVPKNA